MTRLCEYACMITIILFSFNASGQKSASRADAELKQVVERFLVASGNYDVDGMMSMTGPRANVCAVSNRSGDWVTSTYSFEEIAALMKDEGHSPYYEEITKYEIIRSRDRLAMVKAEGMLYRFGSPLSNNHDLFTLARIGNEWKIVNASYTAMQVPEDERQFDIEKFAAGYAQAWGSNNKEFVAAFFEEDGALTVNDGSPASGREAIANTAQGFMTDLPDMVVTCDRVEISKSGYKFYWTLDCTYSGPGGNGKHARVSGHEDWTMGPNNRILNSQGHFPTEEYNRQLGLTPKE